jgi:outer membrane protein OmpA-like peptidoglycan-associated protein
LRRRFARIVLSAMMAALAGCATHLQEPRDYVVFFVTDTATLTTEAHQVVATIAAARADLNPSRITVEGRADGGTPHDATLADERARTVSRALTDAGVDPTMIAIEPSAPPTGTTGVAAHLVTVRFLP